MSYDRHPQTKRQETILLVGGFLSLLAFTHGWYWMGIAYGTIYAMIAACVVYLWLRICSIEPSPRRTWLIKFLIVTTPIIGLGMLFPTRVDPNIDIVIEEVHHERAIQRELRAVLTSETGFDRVDFQIERRKSTNVEIFGTVDSRPDLDRLRSRIGNEAPSLESCSVSWVVGVDDGDNG